ncbi:MAG: deoxyhypusine synthase family protein [Promethearchaeota archaeon]
MTPHSKDDYLKRKIKAFNVKNVNDIEDLLYALKECSFQGRNLGLALDILEKMCTDKKILTVLTLSGAMVPAGMGELICVLIEKKLIDVIVSTGANIIHDFVDACTDIGHYIGNINVSDEDLHKLKINRIYDTFLPEDNYDIAEKQLLKIIKTIFIEKIIHITPSELLRKIGEKIENRSILSIASKYNVPLFVPAFSDSEFALNLIKYVVTDGYDFQFDILGDVQKFAGIIKKAKETGTIIIGGGVPRNWAQQVFPLLEQLDKRISRGYDYSIRIHTALEYDGGLSGCTISESKSWGKYSIDAKYASVWCDATIAFPLLVTGLLQRLKKSEVVGNPR